ncbi:MAG: hypothetical protein Q7S36_02980 [Candidatus Liptonbacteria bacterium]|nr:hypothetical protein [Candidatus Liptonbacteria bacterium]
MNQSILQKLRSKSPEEKRKITIWASSVIVTIIAILWAIYLINSSGQKNPDGAGQNQSFFANLKQSFAKIMESTKK